MPGADRHGVGRVMKSPATPPPPSPAERGTAVEGLHAVRPLRERDGSPGPRSFRATTMQQAVADLHERKRRALDDVDLRARDRYRATGKLTARERVELLLDEGTFVELNAFSQHRATDFDMAAKRTSGDGVITGWGTVDGRTVVVYAHDSRVFGGALGEVFANKIHAVMDLAESIGASIVGLMDGGGARIQEGVVALAGFGGVFRRNVRASGVIPQVSVILGACAGGAVYSPALTDFVVMVRATAGMYITGPDVIRAVTGETVTKEDLGGAEVHGARTGVATLVYEDEVSALEGVRYLLSFLPSNNQELAPRLDPDDDPARGCDELLTIVPVDERSPYDMRAVIESIVDNGEYLELQESWAANIVCAFARLDGHVVGIVGNQPSVLAGALDIDASEKAARFVRTCDAFNIPLVTLVDVPGFLPGTTQEHNGIIRRGAKLLFAYCEATVPRIQVIVRKAFGGAYIVMDSKSIGADLSIAWPSNQIAVMGAAGAADVVFRREIAGSADPGRRREELIEQYENVLLNPYVAAQRGLVDDVIDPAETRAMLVRALSMLRAKRDERPPRKHGNIPL